MAALRSCNLDRATYRAKCPKVFSEHVLTKLGLFIEPAEVRLITDANDLYTWQILPEKKPLFKKQLSKQSIGAYRELCRGVGVSFEAVLTQPRPETSLTSAIERLQAEKLSLTTELDQSTNQAKEATEQKGLSEEEIVRLHSILQAAEIEKQILQQQVQNLTNILDYLRHSTLESMDDFLIWLKVDTGLFPGNQIEPLEGNQSIA